MDPISQEYLDWVWEIPIRSDVVNVGYVTTGAATKAKREQGLSVEDIFRQQLMKFSRFEPLLRRGARGDLNVTPYRCRVHTGVAGPNWLIAGEAASMVDPITANGVTAALRHAAEASRLILRYQKRGSLPIHARATYGSRILQTAKFLNSGIEMAACKESYRLGAIGNGCHSNDVASVADSHHHFSGFARHRCAGRVRAASLGFDS